MTTPEQARAFAIDYGPHNEYQWPLLASNLIRSLADQVQTLTKERDTASLAAAGEIMEAAIVSRGEIDRLTKERDLLIHALGQPVPLSAWEKMGAERDALAAAADSHKVVRDTLTARLNVLEAAARLALDALECNQYLAANNATRTDLMAFNAAIRAIRQAGVK